MMKLRRVGVGWNEARICVLRRSHRNELDVDIRDFSEWTEIGYVRGQDVVAIRSQADHRGVDGVRSSAQREEGPSLRREILVNRHYLDASE